MKVNKTVGIGQVNAPATMERSTTHLLLLASVLLGLSLHFRSVESRPLSTKGRWILDAATGQRVKLRCANWPGHMEAMIPEGLNHKPVNDIAGKLVSLGFNCVRLTWSVHMVMKPEYRNLTVKDSFMALNLTKTADDVRRLNPQVIDKPVIEAFDETVRVLGEAGVMVILDNHVSKPQWCCGEDGNAFFGDADFNTDEWVEALRTMATRFKNAKPVIGMSMRNELRGPKMSWTAWYKHMARGAMTIHAANPDVLIIVSGLSYDSDLTALRNRAPFPVQNDKIVFEAHWYAFTGGRPKAEEYVTKNPNWHCPKEIVDFDQRIGFVMNQPGGKEAVLFMSEFGYDQTGRDEKGKSFLTCFFAFAAETDIDWAIWGLPGSYYWKGRPDFRETFGVLDWGWDKLNDPDFPVRFRLLQELLYDPSSKIPTYQIIFHPKSGKCLWADEKSGNVELRDCINRSRWSYDGKTTASPAKLLSNTTSSSSMCLTMQGVGLPVQVTKNCSQSRWKSESQGLQMATNDGKGQTLCLDWSNNNTAIIITKPCLCLVGETCDQGNPQVQWFKVVNSNIGPADSEMSTGSTSKNLKIEF